MNWNGLPDVCFSRAGTPSSVRLCPTRFALGGPSCILTGVTARKRKILIVDDDAGIRASLAVLVQSWGFEPLQAADAMEATRIVEKQDPDIVITDVVMPE